MKVYSFELSGQMANWRRFYTNSSSLTYFYPTRTNVIGILASILKLERDSYYETLCSENLDIALRIMSPLRKQIQVLNYRSEIAGRTQIKLELVLPKCGDRVKYKLFLHAKNTETQNLIEKLREKVERRDLGYGVYFGQRQFRANITFLELHENKNDNKLDSVQSVDTVVRKKNILGTLDISNVDESNQFVKRYNSDLIPMDFDSQRNIKRCEEVICEPETNKIELTEGHIEEVYQCGDEFISFL